MNCSKKPLFSGVATALITPFKNDKIDFSTMECLIERQICNGISAIIVCGTTGEASTLTIREQLECIKFTLKTVNNRIPVIAGTGSNSTSKALELSLHADDLGCDGLMIVTPYYNKASSEGLIKHYTLIADAVSCPIIIYNVPSRTGVNIPINVYKTLSEHKNINAVKEASGDLNIAKKILSVCENDILIYAGNDDLTYDMLCLGAQGVVSVVSNVAPKETVMICENYFSNNTIEAQNAQRDLNELIKILFCEVNPIPLKYLMQLMGLCNGENPLCRQAHQRFKPFRLYRRCHCRLRKGRRTGLPC